MATQESRLAIVIDTSDAEARIKRLRDRLRDLGNETQNTSNNTENLANSNNNLSQSSNNANNASSKLQSTLRGIGKVAKGLALGVGGLGIATLKVAGDFESAMNGVKAVSGAVGAEFDAMRDKARELGATTAFSATEAANGMEFLAMAGMNTEQVLSTIPNALNLAAAGNLDLATSADILSNIMTGMGMAAEESGRAADVLAAAAAGANVDINMMGETMKYVAPIAKSLGLSLEETAAMAGMLGNAGIQGSQAGTVLRAIGTRIAANKEAQKALEELGVAYTDLEGNIRPLPDIMMDAGKAMEGMGSQQRIANAQAIAGQDAMSGFLSIVDSIETGSLDGLEDKLNNSAGAAQAMAETRMEGLNGQMQGLASAAQELMLSIADTEILKAATSGVTMLANGIRELAAYIPIASEKVTAFFASAEVATAFEMAIDGLQMVWQNLVSVIERTAEIMSPVVEFFREHSALSESLAIAIGLVATAFGVLTVAATVGAAAWSAFGVAMAVATSPITLAIIAITGLTAAAIYLYQNWDAISAKTKEVFDSLPAPIQAAVSVIVSVFTTQFEIIKAVVTTAWEVIKAVFTGNWSEIPNIVSNGMGQVGDAIGSHLDVIKNAIDVGLDAINAAFTSVFNSLPAPVQVALSAITAVVSANLKMAHNLFSTIFEAIIALVHGDMEGVKSAISNGMSRAVDIVKSMGQAIINALKAVGSQMVSIGADLVQGFINGIKSKIGSAVSAASDMGSSALAAVRRAIDSHSPSKETDKLGGYFGDGFTGGINRKTKDVKNAAQKMAEAALSSISNGIASLKKEIALFGNDSPVASFEYDVKEGKCKGVSQAVLDSYKDLLKRKESLIATSKAEKAAQDALKKKYDEVARANQSVTDTIASLDRQIALLGNNSAIGEIVYDFNNTSKYAGVAAEKMMLLISRTKELEQAKKASAASDAYDGLMGDMQQESPMAKLQAEHEERLAILKDAYANEVIALEQFNQDKLAIDKSYVDARRDLLLTQSQELFSGLSGLAKSFAGEQSGIYRAMFAVEKGIAVVRSIIAIQQSVAQAMALPFPSNLPAIGAAVSQGAQVISTIKSVQAPQGFKTGGYTGNIGANNVAGVVHGNEYVFDAQATKRIGVDNLNAIRSGKGVGETSVNITVNVDASGNAQVNQKGASQLGSELAKQMTLVAKQVIAREKRQGGMLSA